MKHQAKGAGPLRLGHLRTSSVKQRLFAKSWQAWSFAVGVHYTALWKSESRLGQTY